MPSALYLTESDEANALLAREPLALLIGFALDQQVTVPTAFAGPLKLEQRIGGLDAKRIASMDPAELEAAFRERPAIHRFPGSMARRVQDLCAVVADEYDGKAERVWTEASDAADLRKRIGALPGFGAMKITGLGSVLALRFGVESAQELVPDHPCLGAIDSPEALAEYQAAKRAHKAELRACLGDRVTPDTEGPIELETLTDGGQRPADIARGVAGFLSQARTSLDIALYDVRFETAAGALVLAALLAAVQRGVAVRLLYNVAHPGPIPVPPPPETAPDAIEALPVATRGIAGIPDLMHHKFVVRDAGAVWTGSTNWTDDSWSRQENVIVTVDSHEVAYAYALAFGQLWESGRVAHSGKVDPRPEDVGSAQVRAWFCPEHGEALSHRVAKQIGKARERVRIASPVLTSGPILATLVEVVNEKRCDVAGVVDDTQVDQVFGQWRTNGVSEWKVPLLQRVIEGASFSGKSSIPWSPTSLHDFMHAKVVVADDTSFVGSFNFSRSGERNAENVLEIRDAAIADRLASFVDEIRGRYPRATVPA